MPNICLIREKNFHSWGRRWKCGNPPQGPSSRASLWNSSSCPEWPWSGRRLQSRPAWRLQIRSAGCWPLWCPWVILGSGSGSKSNSKKLCKLYYNPVLKCKWDLLIMIFDGQIWQFTIWVVVNSWIWPVGAEAYNTIDVRMTGQTRRFTIRVVANWICMCNSRLAIETIWHKYSKLSAPLAPTIIHHSNCKWPQLACQLYCKSPVV